MRRLSPRAAWSRHRTTPARRRTGRPTWPQQSGNWNPRAKARPRPTPTWRHKPYLQMLYLLAGRRDDALAPIPGAQPALQDFWSKQLYGLATWLDTDHTPDTDPPGGRDQAHFQRGHGAAGRGRAAGGPQPGLLHRGAKFRLDHALQEGRIHARSGGAAVRGSGELHRPADRPRLPHLAAEQFPDLRQPRPAGRRS